MQIIPAFSNYECIFLKFVTKLNPPENDLNTFHLIIQIGSSKGGFPH